MVVAAVAAVVEGGLAVEDDAAGAGEPVVAAAAFRLLNQECLAGDGDAAAGDPAVVAVAACFFKCLCFEGLGEAPGVGLLAAICPKTDEMEKAVNAIRGRNFFMADDLSADPPRLQYRNESATDPYENACPPMTRGYPEVYYG